MESHINEKIRKYSYKLQNCGDPEASRTYQKKLNQYQKMQSGGQPNESAFVEQRGDQLGTFVSELANSRFNEFNSVNAENAKLVNDHNKAVEEVKVNIQALSESINNLKGEYAEVEFPEEASKQIAEIVDEDKNNTAELIIRIKDLLNNVAISAEAGTDADIQEKMNALQKIKNLLQEVSSNL